MNAKLIQLVTRELADRGFASDGTAPNGTMALARAYLEVVELSDLLELMAIRRYKLIWSVTTIGQEAVDLSYDDVSKVIDAIKTVIERLLLPTAEEPDGDAG